MSLFRSKKSPDPDGSYDSENGYSVLLDDLRKTTLELKNTYENLGNVVDPDLIDYYIYHAKAMQMRHKFLMDRLKQLEQIP